MPIMNYTTSISVEKTMGEVIGALSRRGVTRISTMYDDNGNPQGIAFTMKTDYGFSEFELPVKVEGVLAALNKEPGVTKSQRTPEHAAKVAWRIARDWLAAQSALIDANLASLDEVMLPYMIGNAKGDTVFQIVRAQRLKEIAS